MFLFFLFLLQPQTTLASKRHILAQLHTYSSTWYSETSIYRVAFSFLAMSKKSWRFMISESFTERFYYQRPPSSTDQDLPIFEALGSRSYRNQEIEPTSINSSAEITRVCHHPLHIVTISNFGVAISSHLELFDVFFHSFQLALI